MKATLVHAARWVGLLAILGVVGCPFMPDNGGKDKPDPKFLLRITPENLLANLKMAYHERETAEYESLLAKDFTFVLSPEDAGQPGMPSQWGRNTEIGIHQRMFDADLVQTLSLDFVIGDRIFDETDQLWTITITNVELSLYGMTTEHPTPKLYRVQNGVSKFWFRQESWTVPGTSDRIWSIVKWEDSPVEGG
jgi:hypothetical protein